MSKRKVMREKTAVRRHLPKTKWQTQHGKVMQEKETSSFLMMSLLRQLEEIIWKSYMREKRKVS